MADADQTENYGPVSDQVKRSWALIHKEASNGAFRYNEIARIGAFIEGEKTKLRQASKLLPDAADDVALAGALHAVNEDRFKANLRSRELDQEYLRELSRDAGDAFDVFNQFLVKTLAYGNGAGAIAGLAYLGTDVGSPKAAVLAVALVLFFSGFCLALINAYLLTRLEDKKSVRYRDATFQYSTAEEISNAFGYRAPWYLVYGGPLTGWLSAVALIAAAVTSFLVVSG
tara:strand:- start:545 stop:1231 length:687 start_codon:yes stop_codon:yes gene_type:complete